MQTAPTRLKNTWFYATSHSSHDQRQTDERNCVSRANTAVNSSSSSSSSSWCRLLRSTCHLHQLRYTAVTLRYTVIVCSPAKMPNRYSRLSDRISVCLCVCLSEWKLPNYISEIALSLTWCKRVIRCSSEPLKRLNFADLWPRRLLESFKFSMGKLLLLNLKTTVSDFNAILRDNYFSWLNKFDEGKWT